MRGSTMSCRRILWDMQISENIIFEGSIEAE